MAPYDTTMQLVSDALRDGNCGLAIQAMETYLTAWPEPQTAQRLADLRADYDRMADYWRQGGTDPARGELYQRLLQRMYVIYANVRHHHQLKAAPYIESLYRRVRQGGGGWSLAAIRQEMENFVSSVALLQLEPEHTRKAKSLTLYRDHQRSMSRLFEYVLTSKQWTDTVRDAFTDMLLSPTIDSADQQLLVAAVMLALRQQFDMAKFRTLADVYRQSADEAVRQRALIGWVLALSEDADAVWPEQRQLVRQLTASEQVCEELTELQMQLIYCLNAEKDTRTMQQEIMPDLMRNHGLRITKNGIEEQDDDPMEDILHPNASEERMEHLEATFQRIDDMQRQGSDIYFGGFSQMKRFPFFYDISNWLTPFYLSHPDIAQAVSKMDEAPFLETIIRKGPFCASDKYSFVLASEQVVNRLPENIRQMLRRGEASLGMAGEIDDQQARTPAYIRRLYLQDLYRFYKLFAHRSELRNPFSDGTDSEALGCEFFSSTLFDGTPLEQRKGQVVRLLKKMRMEPAAQRLLQSYKEDCYDVQYFLWTGQYDRVLQLEPNHERALSGQARQRFNSGDYQQAAQLYDKLSLLHPQKSKYALYRAVCLVRLNDYDEAQRLLYKLNYEQPDDAAVSRTLAWTLMCNGKLEQAGRIYDRLLAAEAPEADDKTHAGYCLWLKGRVADAADLLRGTTDLDTAWLRDRGVSDIDIKMMQALIAHHG